MPYQSAWSVPVVVPREIVDPDDDPAGTEACAMVAGDGPDRYARASRSASRAAKRRCRWDSFEARAGAWVDQRERVEPEKERFGDRWAGPDSADAIAGIIRETSEVKTAALSRP